MRLVLFLLTIGALLAQRQTFDVQMMLSLSRVSEPALSPDGKRSPSPCRRSISKRTSSRNRFMSFPFGAGSPVQLTHDGNDNERPRWSAGFQADLLPFRPRRFLADLGDGRRRRNARQITHLSTEAGGILVSPDGKKIVFLSSVYPECGADDLCNKDKIDAEAKKQGQSAHLYFPAVPSLDRLRNQAAPASSGGRCRRHRT